MSDNIVVNAKINKYKKYTVIATPVTYDWGSK